MLTGIILLLTFVIGILSFGIRNLLLRNEQLEDIIETNYINTKLAINLMRSFDERQMFEKDDEVGEVFSKLLYAVNELEKLMELSNGNNETSEEN